MVHLYGMPARVTEILDISRKYEIPMIEDAAEALGSTFDGKPLGGFGDLGIYSFNGNKIITTSGGGALVSENEAWIQKARFLATQARDPAPHYQHSEIGYNYRLSNVCAGIGRGQMMVLDERVRQRQGKLYTLCGFIGTCAGHHFPGEIEGAFSNRWLTTILIDPAKTNGITRHDVSEALSERNIESRPLWKPMHQQPVFRDAPAYTNGVSEQLFAQGLCLPSSSSLTVADLSRVVEVVKSCELLTYYLRNLLSIK